MIALSQPASEVFVPDGEPLGEALARTTHLGVGAHHDDLEIMAAHGILECFGRTDRWFTGVVVTDGAGSPRAGRYANTGDDAMKQVRRLEQKKAAYVGEYAAQVLLSHPSSTVKDASQASVVEDLASLLSATRPDVVYTHNLADKHDTHVAVALRLVTAARKLSPEARPRKLIGCEVWRDLDWLPDGEKVRMPVDARENLQAALMGVFDSQISGGKRYDLAALGRRRANATFFDSQETDRHEGLIWGMDLTPLLADDADPEALIVAQIRRFEADVLERLAKLR